MSERLRCPFVASPCVEEQCIGWRSDHCFIHELLPVPATDSGILSIFKSFLPSQQKEPEPATNVPIVKVEAIPPSSSKGVLETTILLSLDLGTAYSKAAYRVVDRPVPIAFLPTQFLLASDILFDGKVLALARGVSNQSLIRDAKTQFRQGPLEPCKNILNESLPLTTSECVVYLYYVLLKRSFDLMPRVPATIRLTVPSLVFVSQRELEGWYREAIVKAYSLATHISKTWDEPLSVSELRTLVGRGEYPEIRVVSEPTAALVDLILENHDQVFAVVDIGAGTTDLAVMIRSDGKDSILAEDTIPSGGRFLQRLFEQISRERADQLPWDRDSFHRLLRDASIRINGQEITLDDLFKHPDAIAWIEAINNRLIELKKRAQFMNLVNPYFFSETISHNVYVSGGIGRCPFIRRLILPSRPEFPKPIPVSRTCEEWALQVGNEADDLFLQLAPVVGALSMNAREMGTPPGPINIRHRKPGEDYDQMRGNFR